MPWAWRGDHGRLSGEIRAERHRHATVRVSVRLIGLLSVLVAVGAGAQPLHEDQWASTRVWLTAGTYGRTVNTAFSDGDKIAINGTFPAGTSLQGSFSQYVRKWFGVTVDARAELAKVRLSSDTAADTTYAQHGFKGSVSASFRWQATSLFGLEGRLGVLGGVAPFIDLNLSKIPESDPRSILGPVLTVVGTFDTTPHFTAQVFAGLEARFGGLESGNLFFGLNARYGFLTIGDLELGIALSVEANAGGNTDLKKVVSSYDEKFFRVGIGPSLTVRRPAPAGTGSTVVAPSVVGSVTRVDGSGIGGATVSAGGVTTSTDAQGAYSLEGLAPGPTTVIAEASGFRPAKKDLVVTPGTPVEAPFVLVVPTGPGSISGVVRAGPDKLLAGAKVTVGSATLTTSTTGAWSVDGVGPGPVKVKIALDGYAPADEVVQVPPEAKATLDLTLEPVAQRTKAKIRGVISSASGPVAKATVRIVELKLKQAVKPDGRFEAEVAGGKYTLIIEAPKHVTQTRTVEVLDGDQAIFQIELEKAR